MLLIIAVVLGFLSNNVLTWLMATYAPKRLMDTLRSFTSHPQEWVIVHLRENAVAVEVRIDGAPVGWAALSMCYNKDCSTIHAVDVSVVPIGTEVKLTDLQMGDFNG